MKLTPTELDAMLKRPAMRKANPALLDSTSPEVHQALQRHNEEMGRRKIKNYETTSDSVSPGAITQRSAGDEPVAAQERNGSHPVRHLVRVKSFRTRLCDKQNLCDKYFVDALIYAGALSGDTPKEVEITVDQELVTSKAEERTEIIITEICQ